MLTFKEYYDHRQMVIQYLIEAVNDEILFAGIQSALKQMFLASNYKSAVQNDPQLEKRIIDDVMTATVGLDPNQPPHETQQAVLQAWLDILTKYRTEIDQKATPQTNQAIPASNFGRVQSPTKTSARSGSVANPVSLGLSPNKGGVWPGSMADAPPSYPYIYVKAKNAYFHNPRWDGTQWKGITTD